MVACLLLVISAAVGLAGPAEEAGGEAGLRARGWQALDRVTCEGLLAGRYYELGNDDATVELFVAGPDNLWVSRLPLPEPPYECHEIPEPHFIEEIP